MQIIECSYFLLGDIELLILPVYEEALVIVQLWWRYFYSGGLLFVFASDFDVSVENILSHSCSCPVSGYTLVKEVPYHCFMVNNLCILAVVDLEKACNNILCHAWWVA